MDAHKRMIISDILSKDTIQFIVPIYQREYKWTPAETNRIMNDILNAGKTNKEHFIGSIVYQYTEYNMAHQRLFLVDGQQRLTTIMLISKALNIIAGKKMDDDDYEYVYNKTKRILYIDADDKAKGYSVYPSENDRFVFNVIISAKSYESIIENHMIPQDNYMLNNFINAYKCIDDYIKGGYGIKNVIYNGLLNLSVVEISVDKTENAQIIFESINSLGVKLTNAELIQNFLLMSNKDQESLYINKWKPMKDNLIGESNMETFVKHYLHMKLEYQINDDDIYKEYVKYSNNFIENGEVDREKMIDDLYEVAEVYEPFVHESNHYSSETNNLMKEFRDMDQSTSFPFLMRVFLDHKNNRIKDEELNKVINLIVVYTVRRTICGISSNTLRSFMLTLYRRIFKVKDNYNRYYEAIYAFLSTIRTNDVLRTEDETLDKLKLFALYRNRKFATYLLNRLENGRYPNNYTEKVVADNVSVEHIMPQQLTDDWIAMLGYEEADEIHLKYIDTLGNLSLSSRKKNSIMSNESFQKKKDILKEYKSKFVELNKDIDNYEKFTETEILEREQRLAAIFKDKFELNMVNTEGIRFEDTIEVICDGDVNPIYQGSEIISYCLLGKETPVQTFRQLVISVVKQLYNEFPEVIRTLAVNHFNPWNESSVDCIHYGYGDDDNDPEVIDGIRVHLGFIAKYCVQFCNAIMKECGLDADQLSIFLKKDSIKGTSGVAKKMREEKLIQALQELAADGVINYDHSMPRASTIIKFQIDELTKAINYNGPLFNWDGVDVQACYYVDYSLSNHEIWVTIMAMKDSKSLCDCLLQNSEKLGIQIENPNKVYWHILSFPIDYREALDSDDIVEGIKKQIIPCVDKIKEFAAKLADCYSVD